MSNLLNFSHGPPTNTLINLIKTFPNKSWNWERISRNSNINIQDILNNQELPWDWSQVSQKDSITMKIIIDNPNIQWAWYYISEYANITMKDVLDNPTKNWRYMALSRNNNINMQDILDHPDKEWDWNYISRKSFINDKYDVIRSEKMINIRKLYYEELKKNILPEISYIIVMYIDHKKKYFWERSSTKLPA